jgi:hypothetical protein
MKILKEHKNNVIIQKAENATKLNYIAETIF